MKNFIILAVFCCILATTHCSTLEAQALRSAIVRPVLNTAIRRSDPSTQWYPYVIAREEDRAWIREMPMEDRPNRPMHFWGNSRRRSR